MVVSARARAPGYFGDGSGVRGGHIDASRRRFPAAAAVTASDPNPSCCPLLLPLRFSSEAHSSFDNFNIPPAAPHSPSTESSDVRCIWIQLSDSKIGIFETSASRVSSSTRTDGCARARARLCVCRWVGG